jgi:hypothetical protein
MKFNYGRNILMETQNMMDDALNSFKKLKTGDIVTGVVS